MRPKLKGLASIIAIVCACTSLSGGQKKTIKDSELREVHLNRIEMAHLLSQLAADYGVTIGLELDPNKPNSPITLDLRNVTFPQLLDGIVQSEPRYQWRENDGCIEVLPVNGDLSLLDTPIRSFQVKDVNRDLAINRLLGLPEVQALALSMNLRPRPPHPPSERVKDEKLSFDLSGVTLRQALNRIAEDSGAKFWLFRRYPDGTFEIILSCC
jgi:hypothetical protein